MECFVAFLLLLFVLIVLVGAGFFSRLGASRSDAAFRRLAERYAGSYFSGGWFQRASAQFRYGQDRTPVSVYSTRRGGRNFTHINIAWSDAHSRLEILSRWAYVANQIEFRKLQEMKTGDARFDQEFVVLTNRPEDARALLTSTVRWQTERLRSMLGDNFVHMSLHQATMHVVKQEQPRTFERLDDLTRAALEMYDQMMLTRRVGIEFHEGDGAQLLTEAICQVCGEAIITDMVFCRRCRTPHHQECWQYVGVCSIYGCQERHYFAPQVAQQLESEETPNAEVDETLEKSMLEDAEEDGGAVST